MGWSGEILAEFQRRLLLSAKWHSSGISCYFSGFCNISFHVCHGTCPGFRGCSLGKVLGTPGESLSRDRLWCHLCWIFLAEERTQWNTLCIDMWNILCCGLAGNLRKLLYYYYFLNIYFHWALHWTVVAIICPPTSRVFSLSQMVNGL